MLCANLRERLLQSSTPLTPVLSPMDLLHLATCPACRQFRQEVARIHTAARRLPHTPLPESLRPRILDALPASPVPVRPIGPPRRRLAAGLVAALLGALALIAGPRLFVRPTNAAEVLSAVRKTHTWHLAGWQNKMGKQIPWEIWGRRSPYFYREQIGDEILQDDGTHRIHVIPPQRMHSRGIVLRMPSRPLAPTTDGGNPLDTHAAFLDGIGLGTETYLSELTEVSRTISRIILKAPTVESGDFTQYGLFTVDAHTHLPLQFELRKTIIREFVDHRCHPIRDPEPHIEATLRAEYDSPLPPEVADAVPQPEGYLIADAADSPTLPAVPDPDAAAPAAIATKNGITLQAEALAQDREGNLKLRVRAWLGSAPTNEYKILLAQDISLRCPPYTQPGEGAYPTDDQGGHYVQLNAPEADSTVPQIGFRLCYLTHIEPTPAGATSLPHTVTIPLRARIFLYEDILENGSSSMHTVPIMEENLSITIPLPGKAKDLDYDRPRPHDPGLIYNPANKHKRLRWETAMDRASYYMSEAELWEPGHVHSRPEAFLPVGARRRIPLLQQAVAWYRIWLNESESIQDANAIRDAKLSLKSAQDDLARASKP